MGAVEEVKAAFGLKDDSFDPAVFGSELALKTQWTPLGKEAANFCTHRLRTDPLDGVMRFVGTPGNKAPGVIIACGGLVFAVILLSGVISPLREQLRSLPVLYLAIALLVVADAAFGIWIYRKMNPYIIFDPRCGAFYRSTVDPRKIFELATLPSFTPFKNIGALQLLKKRMQGRESGGITAYELNLVRRDGERVAVVCHGNYRSLAEDAVILSQMLKIPLWDVEILPQTSLRKE